MIYRALFSFGLALCVTAQLFVFGPLAIINGNAEIPLAPSFVLGWPLVAALAMAAAIGLVVIWPAFETRRYRWPAVCAALGVVLYVSFYGFAPELGPLDGRADPFSGLTLRGVIEFLVLIGLLSVALFYKRGNALKPLAAALMLFVTINGGSVLLQADWSVKQQPLVKAASADDLVASNMFRTSTGRTLHTAELSERNVIIILLDTLQNDVFEHLLATNPALRRGFGGFTLYKDATGYFPFTKLSLPVILTGSVYANDEPIPDYMSRVARESLPAVMAASGFSVDLVPLHSRADFLSSTGVRCRALATVWDLYALRQVPILAKQYIYRDGDFVIGQFCSEKVPTNEQERDVAVLDKLISDASVTKLGSNFKFIHFWGMHPPARLDANCEATENRFDLASISEQATCILSKVTDYLNKLRELGVYDKSRIFLVADHGSLLGLMAGDASAPGIPPYVMSAAHPTIAFKEFGPENEFAVSAAPVTLKDLYSTALEGIASPAHGGETLVDIPVDEVRRREFMFYKSAAEASENTLAQVQFFTITGSVRDAGSWSTDRNRASAVLEPLGFVDLGTPEAIKFTDLAFSTEAEGVGASWIVSSPATVTGIVPQASRLLVRIRMLSAHADQDIDVLFNGREVGSWSIRNPNAWLEAELVLDLLPGEAASVGELQLQVKKISPVQAGARALGIFVDWISFEAV